VRPATDRFLTGAFGAKRPASRTTSRRGTSGSSSREATNRSDLEVIPWPRADGLVALVTVLREAL